MSTLAPTDALDFYNALSGCPWEPEEEMGAMVVSPWVSSTRCVLQELYVFATHVRAPLVPADVLARVFVSLRLFGDEWERECPDAQHLPRYCKQSIMEHFESRKAAWSKPSPMQMIQTERCSTMFVGEDFYAALHRSRFVEEASKLEYITFLLKYGFLTQKKFRTLKAGPSA